MPTRNTVIGETVSGGMQFCLLIKDLHVGSIHEKAPTIGDLMRMFLSHVCFLGLIFISWSKESIILALPKKGRHRESSDTISIICTFASSVAQEKARQLHRHALGGNEWLMSTHCCDLPVVHIGRAERRTSWCQDPDDSRISTST